MIQNSHSPANQSFRSYIFVLTLLFTISWQSLAEEPEKLLAPNNKSSIDSIWEKTQKAGAKVYKAGKEKVTNVTKAMDSSSSNRSKKKYGLLGTYSFLDTWVPGKLGLSFARNSTPEGGWELEYLRGTLAVPFIIDDLGKITDQRISLFYRSYSSRNSLSYLYGISYSTFNVHLGTDFISSISGENISQFDIMEVQTLNFNWA